MNKNETHIGWYFVGLIVVCGALVAAQYGYEWAANREMIGTLTFRLAIIGACSAIAIITTLLGKKLYAALCSAGFAAALATMIGAGLLCGLLVEQTGSRFGVGETGTCCPVIKLLRLDAVWHSWWFAFLFIAAAAGCGTMLFKRRESFKLKKLGLRSAGLLLAHLSVIFILAGAWVDHFRGWSGELNLYPGVKSRIVALSNTPEMIELPFRVALLKVEHATTDDDPAESLENPCYRVLIVDGEKKTEALIRPNEPFTYKRIQFIFLANRRLGVSRYPGVPLVFGGFAAMGLGVLLLALRPRRGMSRAEAAGAAVEATPDSAGRTLNRIAFICGALFLAITVGTAITLLPQTFAEDAWAGKIFWFQVFLWSLGATTLVFFLNCFLKKSRALSRICTAIAAIALASGAVFFTLRWMSLGHPPLRSQFEIFALCAWAIIAAYLVIEIAFRMRIMGFFASACAFLFAVIAATKAGPLPEMLPVILRSPWFAPHVISYFLGYGAIFVGFFFAVFALIISFTRIGRIADSPGLALSGNDKLIWGGDYLNIGEYLHRIFMFGFAMLTVGLLTGAAWGLTAWGDYWGWDAKEVAALLTWAAMLGFVHLRATKNISGRKTAIAAIVCVAAVVLAWLVFELLPSSTASLRSYN